MKYILSLILINIAVIPLFSSDRSTPVDGNLYSKTNILYNPSTIIVHKEKKVLNDNGLEIYKGRIFNKNENTPSINNQISNINKYADITYSKDGNIVILTGNQNIYRHGIFGNISEVTGFKVLNNNKIIGDYELINSRIFETLRALIFDIVPENTGNEILLTASDSIQGSRIEAYSMTGKLLGYSDAIGQGYRWFHLLAAGPFGKKRRAQLILVRTPHIGGILEFYEWENNKLVQKASFKGISTHRKGSDNLNMAIAGDFDPAPGSEIIVPANDFKKLLIIKYEDSKVKILNQLILPDKIETNIFFSKETVPSIWIGLKNGSIVQIIGKRTK